MWHIYVAYAHTTYKACGKPVKQGEEQQQSY